MVKGKVRDKGDYKMEKVNWHTSNNNRIIPVPGKCLSWWWW